MEIIEGKLEAFFETGTEGIIWSVYDESKIGYEGLFCLDYGDYIRIYHDYKKESILWEGNINYNWEINYRPYPNNPKNGQQEVLGYWVHGIQENIEPETWGTWFLMGLPVQLIKSDFGKFTPVIKSRIKSFSFSGTIPYLTEGTVGDLIIYFTDNVYLKYRGIDPQIAKEFMFTKDKYNYYLKNIKNKYKEEQVAPFMPF